MEVSNEKRLAAAFYLFTEPNVATSATKAGVSQATLYRWRKDPAFIAEMNDLRRSMVEQGMAKLQAATTMTVETLTAIIQDKAVSHSGPVEIARTAS